MPRMPGIEPADAGLGTRLLYRLVRRTVGKLTGQPRVVEPVKITAHHGRLLLAYGQMEQGQSAAHSVPGVLKLLAAIRTATLIGCPF